MTKADAIKRGDKIVIGDDVYTVKKIEISNIGKHGKSKVRIEAESTKGGMKIIVRPSDYEIKISQ